VDTAADMTVLLAATAVPVVAKAMALALDQELPDRVTMAVQPDKVVLRTQLAVAVKTQQGELATRV
jgi:hypothetical protein